MARCSKLICEKSTERGDNILDIPIQIDIKTSTEVMVYGIDKNIEDHCS